MGKFYPRYQQIFDALKCDIISGTFPAGTSLPTEVEIMERFSASRTTVRNALKLLHEEGMIESRRGVGTTVCTQEMISSHIAHSRVTDVSDIDFYYAMEQPWEEKSSDAIIDTTLAEPTVAKELEVEVGTMVYRIRWLHFLNGVAYNFLTHYMRMDFFPDLDKKLGKLYSLYRQVAIAYHLHFTEAKEEVQPLCASFIEAHFLNVPEGKPLLKLCRTAHCELGPMEYSESILNPDIMKISLTITSRVPTKNAHEP